MIDGHNQRLTGGGIGQALDVELGVRKSVLNLILNRRQVERSARLRRVQLSGTEESIAIADELILSFLADPGKEFIPIAELVADGGSHHILDRVGHRMNLVRCGRDCAVVLHVRVELLRDGGCECRVTGTDGVIRRVVLAKNQREDADRVEP